MSGGPVEGESPAPRKSEGPGGEPGMGDRPRPDSAPPPSPAYSERAFPVAPPDDFDDDFEYVPAERSGDPAPGEPRGAQFDDEAERPFLRPGAPPMPDRPAPGAEQYQYRAARPEPPLAGGRDRAGHRHPTERHPDSGEAIRRLGYPYPPPEGYQGDPYGPEVVPAARPPEPPPGSEDLTIQFTPEEVSRIAAARPEARPGELPVPPRRDDQQAGGSAAGQSGESRRMSPGEYQKASMSPAEYQRLVAESGKAAKPAKRWWQRKS